MAFEVFDDVAFYWFFQVLLGIFLIPITLYRIYNSSSLWGGGIKRRKVITHPVVPEKDIPSYIPTQRLLSEDEKKIESAMDSRYLSLTNIFFVALWVAFALMLVQLPKWHNRQMTDFEPYKILEIERGASLAEIKRAHRKMAIKWHPDRNRESADTLKKAQDMFIMVTKAYAALTDEDTREKYEKYGTPDGYQGTQVTIGLPSMFTAKENELVILAVYFASLIIFVTVGVFWWNNASKYHKSGVFKQSIDIYWRYIKQNMNTERLVDILCASSEYRVLDIMIDSSMTQKMSDLRKLYDEVIRRKPPSKKNKKADAASEMADISLFEAPYAKKANTFITAHLLGLTIPDSIWEEYMFVLQEAPRLLDVMIDVTLNRERFWMQSLQLIQVKQAIVQGVWPNESLLKQLPHWSVPFDQYIRKQGFPELMKLNNLDSNKLSSLLSDAYRFAASSHSQLVAAPVLTGGGDDDDMPAAGASLIDEQEIAEHVSDAVAMIRMYPFVSMEWCARTYDEKEVFENDVITVTVKLHRWHEPWEFDIKNDHIVKKIEPPEMGEKRERLDRLARGELSSSSLNDGKESESNKVGSSPSSFVKDGQDYDEAHGLDFVDSDRKDERKLQILRLNSPVVHVKRFPFRVREKWCVMLVDKMIPAVVDQIAIPALCNLSTVDLHFRINRPAGEYPYALVCKCDSYLGADKSVEFTLKVKELTDEEKTRRIKAAEEAPDYGIDQMDEGLFSMEVDTKWYYLWNENIWEMFLTIFLLYFIYLILVSTPWGKRYLQPCADFIYDNAVFPVATFLYVNMAPVINPGLDFVHQQTGFDVYRWWWGLDLDDEFDDDSSSKEESDKTD